MVAPDRTLRPPELQAALKPEAENINPNPSPFPTLTVLGARLLHTVVEGMQYRVHAGSERQTPSITEQQSSIATQPIISPTFENSLYYIFVSPVSPPLNTPIKPYVLSVDPQVLICGLSFGYRPRYLKNG